MKAQKKTVYVGMSGGVDSSVTAALLVDQGYQVVGVYMKNWTKSLPGFECPWKVDYQDAKRVAVQLGITFKVFDFQKEYKQKVVDYMIGEYKAGRTPNPDIMCNQEVKFKLFFDTAIADGADFIATGHYARLKPLAASSANLAELTTPRSSWRATLSEPPVLTSSTKTYNSLRASAHPSSSSEPKTSGKSVGMFMAKDKNKDQTYFLYRITSQALEKTLFPLGDYTKPEVRLLAERYQLQTAGKKESMGICFVGKVGIKDFLSQYVQTSPGAVINQKGEAIGEHEGAIFYTIGQRSGLGIGGGLPYYVTGKDMKKNEVYVTSDLNDKNLWSSQLQLNDVHWIKSQPQEASLMQIRTRHRGPLVSCRVQYISEGKVEIKLEQEQKAIAPGQSAVLYDGDQVLGGGIIS
jgi:tRNA-uridine 2-sulfurtransferase